MFLGVDPGKKGALALIDSEGKAIDVFSMPLIKNFLGEEVVDSYSIISLLKNTKFTHVIFERPFIRGMDSYDSIFVIISNYTRVRDAILTFSPETIEVSPTDWQKNLLGYRKRRDKSETKERALAFCQQMGFPIEIRPLKSGKNKGNPTWDDGKSDAYCIAEYGRRVIMYKNTFYN